MQDTLLGQNLSFPSEDGEFVQILHGSSHWLCISTIGCKDGEVEVLDSMFSSVPQKVVRQIATLTRTSASNLKFLDTALQRGCATCGLYAIAFETALCVGIDPCSLQFDQESMHPHLLRCLEAGQMTSFPSKKRAMQHRVKASKHIDVHCHCRQPSYGKMIRCTLCSKWFHNKCETVSPRDWKKPSYWTCTKCT